VQQWRISDFMTVFPFQRSQDRAAVSGSISTRSGSRSNSPAWGWSKSSFALFRRPRPEMFWGIAWRNHTQSIHRRTASMAESMYEKGLANRKAVLGAEYVEKSIQNANEFNRPLQELVTTYCWGEIWGREELPRKTRSMLNIAMLTALNGPHELKLHINDIDKK